MDDFSSLVTALEGRFEEPLCNLPDDLRQRAKQDLFPMTWDELNPDQRRSAAHQWDCLHNPTLEHDRKSHWDFFERRNAIKQKINEWQAIATHTATDCTRQEMRLAELNKKLASMEAPLFIAYPKALKLLADRHKATPNEIAAWVFMGPEQGGIAAYLNVNELDPPLRFYYASGGANNFDYLSPLMSCWFLADDIANFQPRDRFITGETLIERWGKQPGIHPEAFIRAKISESRLVDMHPICGMTQGSFPDSEPYPPLQCGLFSQSHVEKIEDEDFSKHEPGNVADTRKAPKRDKALQIAANTLAKQWQNDRGPFSKRNIAEALAISDEWKYMTASRIERLLHKEW